MNYDFCFVFRSKIRTHKVPTGQNPFLTNDAAYEKKTSLRDPIDHLPNSMVLYSRATPDPVRKVQILFEATLHTVDSKPVTLELNPPSSSKKPVRSRHSFTS